MLVVLPVASSAPLSIIDMHLHAFRATDQGPPPVIICAPYDVIPGRDLRWTTQQSFTQTFGKANCRNPLTSAADDYRLRKRSIDYLVRYNIVAVTSGAATTIDQWRKAAPDRVIPGLMFGARDLPSIERLRALHKAGQLAVIGEIGAQ